MRTSLKFLMGLTSMLALSTAANAGSQLIPIVPFPNATSTSVFGIADDNNTIAGSYVSGEDGLTHGFYGTLDGNYTTYDFPGAPDTQARAIDGKGRLITGFSNITATHCEFVEWQANLNSGRSEQITKDEVPLFGIVMGMSKENGFAGDYCTDDGVIHGQLGARYKWASDVTTPFDSPYTGERGVNSAGLVVGFYVDPDTGLQLGTLTQGGTTSVFTYPSDQENYTVFEGVNNSGLTAGQWGDTSGIVHSFTYNTRNGNVTQIDDPNAGSFTQAWGVNRNGLVAVSSDAGAYIYCKNASCPNTGLKAIPLRERTLHVPMSKLLSYGDVKHTSGHAPVKHVLPKGAALQ